MQLKSLKAHDVPSDVLGIWQRRIGDELLPVQARAVEEGVLSGQSLVVLSPTSSGKTFIGEMAATHVGRRNRKALFLVPLKSVAEEKFHDFRARYAPLELSIAISTRDHREFDAAIERGDYRLAIVVYEKLRSLLIASPNLLDEVGVVVVDELQTICDPHRGPGLEVLLTKLRRSGVQLIGLSAVLGNAEPFAEWLGAKLIVNQARPVELRKGVYCRGRFTYREHNTGALGEEQIGSFEARDQREHFVRSIAELARDEPLLAFVPDRPTSCEYAELLARHLAYPPASEAIEELGMAEEGNARTALLATLPRGIAMHNADLTLEERAIVERHFRSGAIRVLVATTTLAMGVNLPVKNVVVTDRWKWGGPGQRPERVDLTPSDFENMGGRAGRLGLADGFGRAILLSSSRFDQEVWMRHLVSGPLDEVAPRLLHRPLNDIVLDLIASRTCDSDRALTTFLLGTFTGRAHWVPEVGRAAFRAMIRSAIAQLLQYRLIGRDAQGRLEISSIGLAAAVRGICAQSAFSMSSWAWEARNTPVTAFETFLNTALVPDAQHTYVRLRTKQQRFHIHDAMELIRRIGAADRPICRWIVDSPGQLTEDDVKSVKRAMILHDWINEKKVETIEKEHFVWAGVIHQLASDFAWLIDGQAAIAELIGWTGERVAVLHALSERLRRGVRTDLLPLSRRPVPGLGRTYLRRLVAAGITTEEGLRAADVEQLTAALRHGGLARKIRAALLAGEAAFELPAPPTHPGEERSVEEARPFPQRPADAPTTCLVAVPAALPPPPAEAPVAPAVAPARRLTFTSYYWNRHCRVELEGKTVRPSVKAFVVLALLALERLNGGEGWVHRLDLGATSDYGWKNIQRLREQLVAVLGPAALRLIENDGHGHYRLSLTADQIELTIDLLAANKAPAVQQLLAQLQRKACA